MTIDPACAKCRFDNAAKARDSLAAACELVRVARETCTEHVGGLLDRILPELARAELSERHEAAHCWDETERAAELKRQAAEAAEAMNGADE